MKQTIGLLIVLGFIAAPALVRSIYRIKSTDDAAVQITTGWSA